jgi:hypothetical protein
MPDVPVWDRSARSAGTFSRDDFVFDRERNVFAQEAWNSLALATSIRAISSTPGASRSACSRCALKPKCVTAVLRKVTRDLDEEARNCPRLGLQKPSNNHAGNARRLRRGLRT